MNRRKFAKMLITALAGLLTSAFVPLQEPKKPDPAQGEEDCLPAPEKRKEIYVNLSVPQDETGRLFGVVIDDSDDDEQERLVLLGGFEEDRVLLSKCKAAAGGCE